MSAHLKSMVAAAPLLLITDAIGILLTAGPGIMALVASIFYLRWIWPSPWFLALAVPLPGIFVGLFLLALFVLRLCTPRLRAGRFSVGLNLGMVAWYCSLALGRAAAAWGLKDAMHSFYFLRYLYYRALGAKIAFGINTAQNITLVDAGMIRIGKGSTIGEGSMITCHVFLGRKLVVRPVTIGNHVFLSKDTLIGPGTTIGEGCWIGLGNRLHGELLAANSRLANFEWEYGSKKNALRAPALGSTSQP